MSQRHFLDRDIEARGCKLTLGQAANLACCLEVIAAKPGNVYRAADFDDLCLGDFLVSGCLIANVIDRGLDLPPGKLIFECVSTTAAGVQTNTNLGIVLLFVPLLKVARRAGGQACLGAGGQQQPNRIQFQPTQVREEIQAWDAQDAEQIYRAIQLSAAGGLGQQQKYDLADKAPDHILTAMQQASEFDQIASEYCSGFELLLEQIAPKLRTAFSRDLGLMDSIVFTHVWSMARYGDSLIRRKCGVEVSNEAQRRAQKTLDQISKHGGEEPDCLAEHQSELAELDFWLRSDGHRRNPGTTADLVAAAILIGLLESWIRLPIRW